MADKTSIEWTRGADGSPGATWNPITGCSVVSPGCTNCYAMRLAGTRLRQHPSRAGLTQDTKAGPVWTGEVRFNEGWLDQPLRWARPRMIFVCAHGDLFHESVPDAWIDKVFAIMAAAHWHTFQVLTKRADRMARYLCDDGAVAAERWVQESHALAPLHPPLARVGWSWAGEDMPWPLPNVWLGVSAEDQRRADERIPHLLATPAAVRWVSAEPLLGPIAFSGERPTEGWNWLTGDAFEVDPSPPSATQWSGNTGRRLDWIVAGGESGPGARPMHPDWARSLRDQCAAAGVAFHFKQHGEWIGVPDLRRLPGGQGPGFGAFDHCAYDRDAEAVRVGKAGAGRLLDGIEHNGMPGDRP